MRETIATTNSPTQKLAKWVVTKLSGLGLESEKQPISLSKEDFTG